MNGVLVNDADLLFLIALVLPAFLLIAYVTLMMMDRHAENDDE
jgi:hypothetical protein